MIVNTQRLFPKLLSGLQIDVVCDVGSMDGVDALTFSAAAPRSRVYAFEPNPHNLRLMRASRALLERNVQIVPLAATNYDGEAEFFLVQAEHAQLDPRRGMSSLHRRSVNGAVGAAVRVKTTRLDSFLADKCPPGGRLALWIDTEGKAYEVIEGATGILEHVHLLHIEVETSPFIGTNQRLYPEVKAFLQRFGFTELATDFATSRNQFNALFIRGEHSAAIDLRVRLSLARARLRYLAVSGLAALVRRLCPDCLRRWELMKARHRALRLQSP